MRDMLTNKTTYNILTTFSLAASAFFMRLSGKTATVFSGLAAASYGGYLLAKNHQVRQHNNRLILLNNHLRGHLRELENAEDLEIPEEIEIPNDFGTTGACVDWMIPAFSGLIFALLPLVNLALNEEDSTATVFYLGLSVVGGLCLAGQHNGASNLRGFNDRLEAQHTIMVNLLTA